MEGCWCRTVHATQKLIMLFLLFLSVISVSLRRVMHAIGSDYCCTMNLPRGLNPLTIPRRDMRVRLPFGHDDTSLSVQLYTLQLN